MFLKKTQKQPEGYWEAAQAGQTCGASPMALYTSAHFSLSVQRWPLVLPTAGIDRFNVAEGTRGLGPAQTD